MEKDLSEKIKSVLDKNFNDQVKFLQQLVRTKSSNPFTPETSLPDEPIELEVAKLIKEKLEEIGLSPEFKGISLNRPNVICEIKGASKKTLILNGHMDTIVPPEDYTFNPYSGEIKDDKLLGVGSADMKASLAIFVYVAKALKNLNLNLNGNLILTFVVDEEPGATSPFGTKFLLENSLRGDAAIVAEPSTKKIAIAQRGGYRFKITTFGKTLHTGTSAWEKLGPKDNAVLGMLKIIEALTGLEIPYSSSKEFPGRGTVFAFPTILKAGSSINVLPGKCEAWGDSRLLPGNTAAQVKKLIISRLKKVKNINYKIQDILFVSPVKISKNEEIVKILSKHSKEILRRQPLLVGAGPWSDAWMFITKGIPAICGFGTDGENVHSKDESIYLDSLGKVTEIYLRTVIDFLGVKE